jgi:hypothetical protein
MRVMGTVCKGRITKNEIFNFFDGKIGKDVTLKGVCNFVNRFDVPLNTFKYFSTPLNVYKERNVLLNSKIEQ